MMRAKSESDAKAARDASIECMALLDRTVFHAERLGPEAFFLAYRRACANLMGELGDIINRAACDYPALVPTEQVWMHVAGSRVSDEELAETELVDMARIRAVLGRVRARVNEIRAVTPLMIGEPEVLNGAVDTVERAVDGRLIG